MRFRLRPTLVVIVVLAAIVLALPQSAPATSGIAANSDQHAAVAAKIAATRAVADRSARPNPPLVPVAIVLAAFGSLALLFVRRDRLVGRRLRRLHDVGHDWRSLLLGAPPALA